MAAEEDIAMGGMNSRALGAILFMGAGNAAMQAFGTLNSSPWTAESFGGDSEKSKACKEYVWHTIGVGTAYGVASAVIAHSLWPIIGVVVINVYLYYLYHRAIRRAEERGSTDWDG